MLHSRSYSNCKMGESFEVFKVGVMSLFWTNMRILQLSLKESELWDI